MFSPCGQIEIIVHDQGPEFMGNAEPGRCCRRFDDAEFRHQLWNLDEECHIEGETEFEAAVAECCDARNRYCNRSRFSAHQRVFGSCLRLLGSLLSDDPIDRQLLTADPYTNFHRANEIRTAAQRALLTQNLHVRYKPQDWHVTDLSREKTSMQEIRPWCGATTI